MIAGGLGFEGSLQKDLRAARLWCPGVLLRCLSGHGLPEPQALVDEAHFKGRKERPLTGPLGLYRGYKGYIEY